MKTRQLQGKWLEMIIWKGMGVWGGGNRPQPGAEFRNRSGFPPRDRRGVWCWFQLLAKIQPKSRPGLQVPALVSGIILVLLLACPAAVYAADTEGEDSDRTLAPYLWIQDEDVSVDSFPLKETHVSTSISGVIAETYVTQVYTNQGEKPINASYLFPASANVTVHGMTMQIGSQRVTAVIREKEEAKEEFEEAKREGKSASLLEQQRPNVFSMDVANIMPGDEVHIELHYTELITPREGVYQFVFPTVVGPRFATPEGDPSSDDREENRSKTSSYEKEQVSAEKEEDSWVEAPYYKEGTAKDGKYDIEVNLSMAVPIQGLTCKSHPINSRMGDGDTTARVTLADPEDFAGDRDFILDYQLSGEEVTCGLMLSAGGDAGRSNGAGNGEEAGKSDAGGSTDEAGRSGVSGSTDGAGKSGASGSTDGAGKPGTDENFFMLMVQPPQRVEPEEILPREYIFVLDVSGSMIGYPLNTAKEMIRDLVSGLKKTDKFNVILFSMDSLKLSSRSLPATRNNIDKALKFIEEQEGGGGTMLSQALEKAVDIPASDGTARNVVIVTDGYISGEKEVFGIIQEHMDNTSFFAFGIGSSVNRYLIDGIAKTGLGESFVVTDSQDASQAAEHFRDYIEAPLLTDVQVEYDGFEAYDTEPEKVPVLFAQRPIVIFGKWKGSPSGTIRLTGNAGGQEYCQEIPVTEASLVDHGSGIRYLWARTRVQKLTDYGYNQEDDPQVKKEVTDIGLKYSMMTPYTSFIAVLDVVRNENGDSTDVDQPLPLPAGVTENALGNVSVSGGGYTTGSEPGEIALWLMLAVVMCLPVVRRIRRR